MFTAYSDADLMLIDPAASSEIHLHTLHGTADYTLYEGWKLKGNITTVIRRDDVLYQHLYLQECQGVVDLFPDM